MGVPIVFFYISVKKACPQTEQNRIDLYHSLTLSSFVFLTAVCVLTCHGLSQSRGIGKAPTQAPITVQATVICRQVSHTDIALVAETRQNKDC